MKRFLILAMLVCSGVWGVMAQPSDTFEFPRQSDQAFVLTTTGGLQVGQLTGAELPFSTIDIDYAPTAPNRWARVDRFGIIRYVSPENTVEIPYEFPPFFQGYFVQEPPDNKTFVREVEWSPDGTMLAFRSENELVQLTSPELNQGVWFYAPFFELATDPSYQILRHCPPFCSAAGTRDDDPGWRSTSLEWSSDNNAILIGLRLLDTNRRALTVRFSNRDANQTQAGLPPTPLFYEFGHWAQDGQNIMVSGRDGQDIPVFGTVGRDGSLPQTIPASVIGLNWVQDAVDTIDPETGDRRLLMLGSAISPESPLQIVDGNGDVLTEPIGDAAPQRVLWSPDRQAVLLEVDGLTYVALLDGTIYDLTSVVQGSPNLDWVIGIPPGGLFAPLPLPIPITSGTTPTPTAIPVATVAAPTAAPPPVQSTPEQTFAIGQLLRLESGTLDIFAEPITSASVVGTLNTGSELIITDGPLQSGDFVWYRVQTLTATGWINDLVNLVVPDS